MKNLIIVCDEKHQKYADFLAQLISLEDDKGDSIVGVKDGAVAAQVWLEKDYLANSRTISSNQYILFVGNSKLAKDKRSHMMVKYEHYGMKYGWLGKQAALCVDEVVGVDEYDDFFNYAVGNQSNVERLIEAKKAESEEILVEDPAHMVVIVPDFIQKFKNIGKMAIKQMTSNNKLEDQQYSCLTYVFYLNGLSEFLGMNK